MRLESMKPQKRETKRQQDIAFIKRFQINFDLIRSHKTPGIQLRLGEKPGETIANYKGVNGDLNL